ncbi:NAD(P)/FAD-dependent oxidoreductase [Velocimicrobium porci]|uniref:NADH:ubiquinone reductase (non-electrogenic) n=1 Tax=Velocimicrobium porci TaxID=2606634 RepID=A0A6L5XVF1_9FIRM|nr:NAD(P)/FAD-dependent oxidoreductase [Velocimicrobium porci]MSS62321.1 NAD(P)/FAD-dependent oxidoreductase [Velocimicrobium porci]
MKKIVIIGAGYAGVLTAKKLEKKLRKEEVSISIIDKNPFHTMLTELHEVAANRVEEDSIKMSLKKIFAGRNVNVILDTVSHIEFDKQVVYGKEKVYEYDYLVLAAGSKPTFFGVPGAEEFSYKLWSYEDAVLLKERILTQFRKASCETNLEEKKKLLSFYIVGAGFTGVEMAGELGEYIPVLCEEFEIERSLVKIVDVDILKRTVPILPEKLSAKVEKRLTKMGVSVQLETSVVGIEDGFIVLKKGEEIHRKPAGTVIWTAGIESAEITKETSKLLTASGRGRIEVDRYLRSLEREEVYVVGDNMMYIPEGEQSPVPQMVENCEQSADVAAHNITVSITGKKEMQVYKPSFHGVMVSVGGRYGVARVGLPNHMFNLPSFFAMFAKHLINIIYFIQVLGWNKVFSYTKHEFFTVRHCRSFVGGHFSNRTPSFLLVPLRVWLGAVWAFEGILKILEGWFQNPMLTGFFGGARTWFDQILYGMSNATGTLDAISQATGAIDATAQATGAAEAVSSGVAIFSYNILGLFDISMVSGKEIAASGLADYAIQLNVPLINWFVDTIVLSSDEMQIFMQITIVLIEIGIGFALMGGFLTTPVAVVSLILQFMFVCTTGLYLNTFWMIFAGIALLIGGGRTLGLDYYVMPWLKKQWKKIPFVKRWYIYHD